ncbi:MAG: tetrathionate reductase family octaheme c-type cytochrome [Ignavibacteriota bacterium]|nr:tetrathionate reductase family octaheme c-type cytochrome [Ignavibacteriota bacterium]MCO6448330.1 tetrathionate reductase family octaheme c-type cytochrome [Ignavibacterium album]MCZ2268702.1 tetrathionate reductase family octaheme c-type cytochrome [Ignavibacteriales bacterium]QKJ98730.1 MAG: tetrathionate reductase family octaheme c-type cytochrome [Ignavibacteriota bacterium]HOJ08319.1 tetrathionate reductase family octaheme c-type cytochrome [Ignavibacteriaceae bacterium]
MRKIVVILAFIGLLIIIAIGFFSQRDYEPTTLMKLKEKYSKKYFPSVDHSKFTSLQQKFSSPQQVTAACISCHNKRHQEVMQSNHWNWEREEYIEGKGIVYLGKRNAINNFCIGTQGNEESCAKCHIGYGMTSKGKSFTDSTNVDCLVCHDNTETYVKESEKGGMPLATLNFNEIAQSVGKPKLSNCGVCHFYGGGGNNVKHGDLDEAMFETTRDVDVHMGTDGAKLQCVDCHTTEKHNISGKVYSLSSMNMDRNTCEQCHTATPHEENILNEHTIKVACQSCHIPIYAKVNSTKMSWDWSTAGKLRNGEPYEENDSLGNHTYLSIKGDFTWDRNVVPDYIWFNGTASHYLEGDLISDTTRPLVLNQLHGSYADDDSKIYPVKIHKAKQPYDPVNKILIKPKLYADKKGEGALWIDFDWHSAAVEGMKEANLPFSGQIAFINTEMYWPVNHMVSVKENTLDCNGCHTRENSRLAGLNDFYMPGRDYSNIVEVGGVWMLILTLLGVLAHASVRIFVAVKSKKEGKR